ncbi:DNA polymerase III subunit delta [Chromobacterium subtsugae]|uniref:DNA polymerase III subunit delta n=1 Tax=Chromobacterium subtsugae TaxID=251747 RepID=A0ABS7FIK4_9NEIS|nr:MULTISPECIES: DNA polymerase III subunit delta [Chromobacterium]KUM04386.1 DNA polymerase III subunit delta [Chromobacterium subtsugae]KZE87403.1 DNA polymerase III subunit delta [Chromobacterium sp. F49]MBW7566540.1 DNA polymerase III subunit delta [Chromobacterium subtsugae]MBW8289909.1 DNA polymerase III subunit delta [Chromobacterium subtsugae]OBU87309.1 DNA polymerase III subunit delta [Chromobacterium subtsugae]
MPSLSPDALTAALAKGLAPLYLVHGEEALLALEAADAVRAAARAAGYLEREVLTVEAGFDWSQLFDAMSSVSLFASLKLLEIRIPGGKPGTEGSEALQRLAANPPADTLTLITLPKLDKTQQQGKWFAALEKAGLAVEARPVGRAELPGWISRRLKAQGQQLGSEALAFFVERVEGNLLAARQEVDKLALLYPKGELSLADLQAAVANVARFDVFQLSESWLAGDAPRLMRMLDGLMAEGEAPVLVLWSLSEDVRMLLRLRQGLKDGRQLRDMARELRLWGDKQRLAEPALRRIGPRKLMQALSECARIDRQIKGVEPGEPWQTMRALATLLAA